MTRERDPENEWLWREPSTPEQLAEIQQRALRLFREERPVKGAEMTLEKFTCHECGLREVCTLAYDGYNTDGDCLYEK